MDMPIQSIDQAKLEAFLGRAITIAWAEWATPGTGSTHIQMFLMLPKHSDI